jgi:Helix-turn-helix domain
MRALFKLDPNWSNPAEFAVMVVLADFANREGEAWPSKPTIARRIGVGPKQVGRITRALEQRGLIAIDVGAAPRGGNRYTLLFEPMTVDTSVHSDGRPTVDTSVHSQSAVTVDADVHGRSRNGGHSEPLTVDIAHSTVDTQVPRQWTPVSPNPSTEPVLRDPEYRTSPSANASSLAHDDEERKHADMMRTKSAAMNYEGRCASQEELAEAVRPTLGDVDPTAFKVGIQFAWLRRVAARTPSSRRRSA